MNRLTLPCLVSLALVACTETNVPVDAPVPEVAAADQTRPQARPDGVAAAALTRPPPPAARTVEEFDTTTIEERAEAAAAPAEPAAERALGTTVASLGDPTQPGFWMETPLVNEVTQGRVRYPTTGLSAQVELRPIDGPATAGSRLSLPAMRLIEAPLTDLPTIEVYAGGAGDQT